MAQNRLSATASRILRSAQLNAGKPLHEIAKETRVPVHTVQYWLNKLSEQEIIRRGVVVNPFRIGESRYGFYFSVAPHGLKHKSKLFRFLSLHERVIWYGELGAEFQFGTSLIAKNGAEIQEFLVELERKTGMTYIRKSLSFLNDFTMLEKTYLYENKSSSKRDKLAIVAPSTSIDVDDIDRKILSVINECSSHLEVMRRTGVPRQTIDNRVQKLRSHGVILRDVYYISAARLGFHVFRILVTLVNQQNAAWKRLSDFCEKEPHIVNFSRCVGSWDGEIVIESESSAHVAQIGADLAAALGSEILDMRIVPILSQKTAIRTMGKSVPESAAVQLN